MCSDIVLNAIKRRSPIMATASAVTCNHFDVDAFVSVWSAMNPDLALQYEVIHPGPPHRQIMRCERELMG
jgi:hypothetical protein